MQTRAPLRSAWSGRPRGFLAVLVFTALAIQLGCVGPSESSNLNPSTFGQTVTFTGTATGSGVTPTGTMDFLDGSTTLASGVPLDGTGKAVFATSNLAIGSHSMTVHYSGDANYSAGNSSPLTQVVRAASTSLYTVTPCRLVDTRGPNGSLGGPSLVAGQGRTFTLAGSCSIPSDATALAVNITIVGPSAPGFVTLYAGGTPQPNTSNLNFSAGQIRANNAIVTLGALGDVTAFLGQASGNAHLIIDVNGYLR
jgi:Big-like domain-containing protein